MRTWKTCADEGIALYKCCNLLGAEELFVESVRRARNDDASAAHLAQTLNNLAIVYMARAKYQDAENAIREALNLVQKGESSAHRLQRILGMHLRAQILVDQEKYSEAREWIMIALQMLGDELLFCSAELWFSLVKTYVGLGQLDRADDAVDSFLRTAPLAIMGEYKVYIDDACGVSYFGPGWQNDEGTDGSTMQVETEVRALLIRATLKNQLPSQAGIVLQDALRLCDQLGNHYLAAQTLVFASRLAFGGSEWAEAARYCRQSLDIAEKVYGPSHPGLLAYLINTASLTLMTDGLPDCISLMDRTFQIVNEAFGPRHPKFARCQLMWSGLLPFIDADNTTIATQQEKLVSDALETFMDFFDDFHSTVISSKLQLAELLIKTDRMDDADILLKQILFDATTISTTNPYPFIGCLSEMLKLSDSLADPDRYKLWEFIHEQLHRFDHEAIEGSGRKIDVMRQIAYVFQKLGDREKPEQFLKRCYELSASLDSDLHHRCKHDLVTLLIDLDKSEEALELLNDTADEITIPQNLRDQVQLAKVLMSLRRTNEAEHLALGAMSQAERLLPDCSDSFMQLIGILTDMYITQNRLDEAVRMIGILTSRKNVLGVPVMDVIPLSLRLIADAFALQHDRRAEQLYEQSIVAAEEIRGKAPETLDSCLVSFAEFCLTTGQNEKARKLFDMWLELRREVCGEESYACAVAMLNVAEMNMEFDLGKALHLSMRALEIVEQQPGADPAYLVAALRLRSAILERSNNTAEAMALAERARKLESKSGKKRKSDSEVR